MNMSQIKEQDKTPEKDLSEIEVSNLPNKQFKVMIIKCSAHLGGQWMDTMRNLDGHRELENERKNPKIKGKKY